MECLFIFISSERQNNIIYEELIKTADELKCLNQKKPNPILKSLSLKPCNEKGELFCSSEISEINHNWENQIPEIGFEFREICDEFYSDDYFRLAERLHKICDEEITSGRTNTQILWCVDKYTPCPSEVPEFYGVVERLKLWHNCCFTVVTNNECNVVEWSSVFSFQVVNSCVQVVNDAMHTIWTGQLGLKLESRNSLTEIGAVCLQTNIYGKTTSNLKNLSESYILPVAELFEDIDLGSIPWPCILPGSIYQLKCCPYNEPDENETLSNLFSKMSNRTGVGALLRIRYSDFPPTLMHPESLQTNCWKRTIADGQFTTTSSLQFKGYHQCQVFLLTSEGSTDQMIHAIALQDLTACGEDVMKRALNESTNQLDSSNEDGKQNIENHIYDLLKETPHLTSIQIAAMSHLLVKLPLNIRKRLERSGQNINNLWTETKEELEYLTNYEIFNHIFMVRPPMCMVHSPDTILEPEILAPKECWPEYRALKGTKQPDINMSTTSQNILSTLIPEGAPVRFKADQLLKFFSMTGNPSETISGKMEKFSPKGKNQFTRTFQQFHEINTNWPESLHSSYHGIHYNTGEEQEKFDDSCSKIKDNWIVEETLSTCSPFQQKESISSWKNISKKRPRSLVDSDQRSNRSGSSYHTYNQFTAVQNRFPRRSPRKKVRQDTARSVLKASDLLKLETSGVNGPKKTRTAVRVPVASEMSDLHTRKLRNVVLNALESEKITVNNTIFKSCFKKLFAVCKPFVADVIGLGSTTRSMQKIAKSHIKQVIEFENLKKR